MAKKIIEEKIKEEKKLYKLAQSDAMAYETLYAYEQGNIDVDNNKKTFSLTQEYIKKNVNQKSVEMCFDLDMTNGPILCKYSKDGRFLLVRNETGYVLSVDTLKMRTFFEEDIKDTIYDATYLHNEDFFALAQKRNVFIYNKQGVEVHAVGENNNVKKLEYLPYHFLLVSVSSDGFLKYQDTTNGKMVAKVFVKDKNIASLKQCINSGVVYTGHNNGTVSTWSPNTSTYLSKILCHRTPIKSIEVDRAGRYMYTTAVDQCIKVWDIRNTYKSVNTVKTNFSFNYTALSQQSILAASCADKVRVFKNLDTANKKDVLYLKHRTVGKNITSLCFKSFEDMLTIGHASGVSNMIVPGSGDPTYDTYEDSPFLTTRQKQEKEVKMLLDKLPSSFIGTNVLDVEEEKPKVESKPRHRQIEDVDKLRNVLSKYLRK